MSVPGEHKCCKQRSALPRIAGKSLLIVLRSVFAFLYFITSLFINFLQLVNYILFQFTWPSLRRRINFYLQDIILSQNTALLELNCDVTFRLFYANQETKDKFGKEHCLTIGNHRYQMDGLFYWLTCEMTNTLGSAKAYAKSDLRYMPIIGWMFFFGEFIFLRRNWKEDAKNIGPALDTLMASPFPFVLLILPEGTRFTPEKFAAGLTYAKEQNLNVNLKYHLLPRVKGFASSLRHLQSKYSSDDFGVYHIQLVSRSEYDSDAYEPNMTNFIMGRPMKVDCYLEKINHNRLPKADSTDEEEAQFLYSVFEDKDKLVEHHREFNRFPQSILQVKKPCLWRLARFFLLNVVMSGSAVGYLIYLAFITHSLALRFTIFGLIIFVFAGIFLILNLLQNSQYGAKKSKKGNKNIATTSQNGQQDNNNKAHQS